MRTVKHICFVAALLASLPGLPATVCTNTVDGIMWVYTVDNGYASVGYGSWSTAVPLSTSGAITIPSKLGGYTVTSVGSFAFYGCCYLTSVTIPDSVTSIGSYAFRNCSSLTSVTIPDSVTSIGSYAFDGCSGLTSVTIPDSVTSIGSYAFDGCSGLTSVTIPDSVTSIGSYAFRNCSGLTSVTIAQYVCSSRLSTVFSSSYTAITNVVVSDGVTRIENYAFSGCSGLVSVTIPDSVTCIEAAAFRNCSVSLYDTNSIPGVKLVDGWVIGNVGVPSGNINLKDVRGIGDEAFYNCRGLTGVTIPDSVTSIGSYAFDGCSGLTSVTIGNGVTNIGKCAFSYCGGLVAFSVDTSNVMFSSVNGLLLSKGCQTLVCGINGDVVIPDGVTEIGEDAFCGYSGLTSVTIPDGVTSIGSEAFRNCSGLTSVTIPNSVTSIGDEAFYNCRGLTSVTIPDSVTSIGSYAFSGCSGLTSMTIPDSITSIGSCAFANCSGLSSVTMPNSVTSIGLFAFNYCTNLTNVTIPNSVTNIGRYAFERCNCLARIEFFGNAPFVGEAAFTNVASGCTAYVLRDSTGWNTTIPGKWQGINIDYLRYTVTFNANGGSGGTSGSYDYGSAITAPTVMRTGYTFSGWVPEVDATVPASNVTYTAQWTVNKYAVIFDANGGEGGTSWTCDYGSEITAPTVTRTGYTFSGWVPAVDATVPASNVTYTAQWTINKYRVAFNANGGIGGTSGTYEYGSAITAPTVTKTGYTFSKWVPAVDATVPAKNVTYWAIWTANKYTVTYDVNGGSLNGASSSVLRTYGQTYGSLPAPTRTEATFLGWYLDESCISSTSKVQTASDHTLVARWNVNTYSVTFEANGGTGGTSAVMEYGSPIVSATVSRTGYTLANWEPAVDATVPASNVTYIAQWTPNTYVIHFDANGGSLGDATNECEVVYDSEYGPMPVPVRPEYVFLGWFTEAAGGAQIQEGDTVSITNDMAFYAHWQALWTTTENGDGTLTLTGSCNPPQGGLTIPAAIDGLPITRIADNAFAGCTNITSVVIPEGVESIGAYAFRNCTWVESVIMPNSVTNVDRNAFSSCSNIASVAIPQCVCSSGLSSVFSSSAITNVVVNAGVTNIGDYAFFLYKGLTSVTMPASVTAIGNYAFLFCSGLTSVTIPDGVMSIGEEAFLGCRLTSVEIPNSVTNIGSYAFDSCNLTSVTIPKSVMNIGDRAFACSGMTAFSVDSGNRQYASIDGLLLSNDCKTLIAVPCGLASVMMPDSVASVGDSAFASSMIPKVE